MNIIYKFAAASLAAVTAAAFGVSAHDCGWAELKAIRVQPSGASVDTVYDDDSGIKAPLYVPSASPVETLEELPEAYCSETTPIRNQGSYNTCWAFSGLGTLETYLLKEGRGEYDFSEQHLSWWSTAEYNESGYGWLAPNLQYGGYSMMSAGYFLSWQGPKLESDMPYIASGNANLPDNMDVLDTAVHVTGIAYVHNDMESLKTAIYKYGAVATSYNNGSGYSDGKKAYYSGDMVSNFSGHAITVVGWDDNFPRENFDEDKRPENDGAWLIKNSWGEFKGDDGYLWVSYEDRYIFDNETWGVNYAVTSVRSVNDYDVLYQNEEYGATYFTYLASGGRTLPKATFVNVFDFDVEHPYLQEVIFETQVYNADYTVYYIPVDAGVPTADRTLWTELAGGTVSQTGYICADVSGKVEVGGTAAIGVEIDTTRSGSGSACLGVDEWLTVPSTGEFIFLPEQQRGESFIINGRNVHDLVDVYAENDDDVGGTLVIKAVAASDVIGDANDDAVVDTTDALTVLRESVGLSAELSELQASNCDVNFDAFITSDDALMILRKSAGLLPEF